MGNLANVYVQYVKNYYRSKSFYLMLTLILVISVLMTYFSLKYVNDLPAFLGKNVPFHVKKVLFYFLWAFVLINIPVFSSVFFGSPAISSEIENRTAYYIFPLPINRYKLYIGKYLSAFTVTFIIVLIYSAFEVIILHYLFGSIPISFLYSIGLLAIFIFTILSITFMISSIFNKNTYAYITVFIIYYIVFEAGSLIINLLYKITPIYLLNEAADIVEKVYLNINTSSFVSTPSLAPADNSEIYTSILIMIIYMIISFVAGIIIFERKEVS